MNFGFVHLAVARPAVSNDRNWPGPVVGQRLLLGSDCTIAVTAVGQPREVLQSATTPHGAAAAKSLLRLLRQRNKLGGQRLSGWLTG